MQLTRDDILDKVNDLKREKYEIESWGGHVYLSELTADQLDSYITSILEEPGNNKARSKLLVRAITDENGERIFRNKDRSEVGKLPASVLKEMFDIACRLSGITQDQQELVKNSESTPSDNSSSD